MDIKRAYYTLKSQWGVNDAKKLLSIVLSFPSFKKLHFDYGVILYRNDSYRVINSILHKSAKIDENLCIVTLGIHQDNLGDDVHFAAPTLEYVGNEMFRYYEMIVL